jgi:hypothetical protein
MFFAMSDLTDVGISSALCIITASVALGGCKDSSRGGSVETWRPGGDGLRQVQISGGAQCDDREGAHQDHDDWREALMPWM